MTLHGSLQRAGRTKGEKETEGLGYGLKWKKLRRRGHKERGREGERDKYGSVDDWNGNK